MHRYGGAHGYQSRLRDFVLAIREMQLWHFWSEKQPHLSLTRKSSDEPMSGFSRRRLAQERLVALDIILVIRNFHVLICSASPPPPFPTHHRRLRAAIATETSSTRNSCYCL